MSSNSFPAKAFGSRIAAMLPGPRDSDHHVSGRGSRRNGHLDGRRVPTCGSCRCPVEFNRIASAGSESYR
jgi:hypothetical protein